MKKIFLMSSFTLFLAFVSLFGNNVATKIATKPTTAYALQTDSVASDVLNLRCKSAYCMDANSKTTVYAQNQTQRLPIASMCKIMTLILCFDAIESGKMDYTPSSLGTCTGNFPGEIDLLHPDCLIAELRKNPKYAECFAE